MLPVGRGAVDLAASEAPRPLCPCHGYPMRARVDRPGTWRCVIKLRINDRRYRKNSTKCEERRRRLLQDGLCGTCGKDVVVTDTRCFECAQVQDEWARTRLR